MVKKFAILSIVLACVFGGAVIVGFLVSTHQKKVSVPELFQPCGGDILEGVCYESDVNRLAAVTVAAIIFKDPTICDQIDFGQSSRGAFSSDEINQTRCRTEFFIANKMVSACLGQPMLFASECVTGIATQTQNVEICAQHIPQFLSDCKKKVQNKQYHREMFDGLL